MIDKQKEASYDESPHELESGGRFYFWLIAAAAAIFIFLLFYSQKIHGTM